MIWELAGRTEKSSYIYIKNFPIQLFLQAVIATAELIAI